MELSRSQRLVYDMEQYAGGSIAVICGSMLLPGERSIADLQAAVNGLYRLNPALRTRIVGAEQVVENCREREVEVLRFQSKEELDRDAADYAKVPLDFHGELSQIRIVLLSGRYGLLVKLHHIISDAWTLALLASQFNALLNGETPSAYPYADHLADEAAYLESDRYAKDHAFFLEQFQKCQEVTYLSEKQGASFAAKRMTFVIDATDTARLTAYAQAQGVSPFILFFTALSAYMSRVKGNAEKFYVGTAVLNRAGAREKHTAGMFVNTVPVLVELDNEKSFADDLAAVKSTLFGVFRHQRFNYSDALAAIRQEYGFTEKLYDVMLSYQNAAIAGDGVESTWYHCGAQTESLQIHIDDRDSEGIFRVHYDYQTEKFTPGEIEALHHHLLTLLFDAMAHDDRKLYELELLTPEEKGKLLHNFNDTAVDYPREKCVHQLFEEQAVRTPEKIAVIACDKTLTYRELNEEANRIAHGLMDHGVKPGDIVAFMLPRRSYLIPTMFGILKAGAAYLPIDPDYPQERIDYMLFDSDTKLLLTERSVSEFLQNGNGQNPHVYVEKEAKYCVIYTSGSTGKPKGCVLLHQGVCNFCVNNNVMDFFKRQGKKPVGISLNNVTFDYFIAENIVLLLNGYTTVLCDEEQSVLPNEFWDLCAQYGVNLIQTTPTKFRLMLDSPKCEYLKNFSLLVTSGEPLTVELVRELRKYTAAEIFNPLGPSETTVWSPNGEHIVGEDIHIGKPLANTQNYILDKCLHPVPIGVTGELCIAGDGVGAGYLNRPELTAEKFISNPFGPGKLYRTGDLAYWREDGNIVYVGRNDFQVKIRGLRIELGEIENALQGVEGISQAVVIVRKDDTARQLICAFYTGEEQDGKALRTAIGQKLPKYMLPHVFTHLDALPLTSSGKVNRKALPKVDLSQPITAEYVSPKGETEFRLAALMEQVLNYSPVGRDDDFFDLGGDSLKAIEFVSKAHQGGIVFDLQSVFDCPTVRALAERIREKDRPHAAYDPVDFEKYAPILRRNRLDPTFTPEKRSMGDIFLTGATGFLGSHILGQFMEQESGAVYCLVRQDEKRLWDTLRYYFGDKYDGNPRIVPIMGELGALGKLDIPPVDMVIHAAASVKHYGSYAYFKQINVEGTHAAVELARRQRTKLVHISTISVSGNSVGDTFERFQSNQELFFSESDLYIGQPLENVYTRSKFEAERLVLDAMLEGLEANIIRMGNLTNRKSDGLFQPNYESNAFVRRVKALLKLGCLPDYIVPLYTEFSPVDCAADAVLRIAEHFNQQATVFHVNSEKGLYFTDLLPMLKTLGIPMEVVTGPEFARQLREMGGGFAYEALINDLDEHGQLVYDSNIRIENDFTVGYLQQLGFEWPVIDLEYIKKFAEHFGRIGYWEV